MPKEEPPFNGDDAPVVDVYKGMSIDVYERGKGTDARYLADSASTFIKIGFSVALVIISLALLWFGGYTSWNHKDVKVRENAISLMAIPAGLVAGLLGGIGLR